MFTSNEQILPRTFVTGVAFSFLNLFYVTFRSPKNYSEVTYRALHAEKVVSNGGAGGERVNLPKLRRPLSDVFIGHVGVVMSWS